MNADGIGRSREIGRMQDNDADGQWEKLTAKDIKKLSLSGDSNRFIFNEMVPFFIVQIFLLTLI